MKSLYMNYVMSERFVHKLPHHGGHSGFSMEWGNFISEGQPAFVVNPKIGACLIWARKEMTLSDIGISKLFYLITPIRPTPDLKERAVMDKEERRRLKKHAKLAVVPDSHGPADSRFGPRPGVYPGQHEILTLHGPFGKWVPVGIPNRKPLKIVAGDYYEVPANVLLPDGGAINYIVPLNCIILNIITPDSGGDGVVLVELKSSEGILTLTMKEFNDIMTADPEQPQTGDFMRAYSAFHMTNPTIVAKLLPTAKRTFSDGAKPYLLTTNFAAVAAKYESRPKAHLFHP